MISERIRYLRERSNLTQSDLAKRLNITRSSVNAWEMGISVPATSTIVQLSEIFHVSTDYLLLENRNPDMINIGKLNEEERNILFSLLSYFQAQKTE